MGLHKKYRQLNIFFKLYYGIHPYKNSGQTKGTSLFPTLGDFGPKDDPLSVKKKITSLYPRS